MVFVTFSSILKHPNKSFFNPIHIFDIFYHTLLLFYNLLFSFNVKNNFLQATDATNATEKDTATKQVAKGDTRSARKSALNFLAVVCSLSSEDPNQKKMKNGGNKKKGKKKK